MKKMSLTKEDLISAVNTAVKTALESQGSASPTPLECPGCGTKLAGVPAYLDHRVQEYVESSLEEIKKTVGEIKVPTTQEFLAECKDGVCGIIEEVYDITKKVAPPPEVVPEVDQEPELLQDYNEPEDVPPV